MESKVKILVCFVLTFIHAAYGAEWYRVNRVVDGDTVVLEKIGKVRLIGIDTPETVHPNKHAEYFGKEASEFLKKLTVGKVVRIEYEGNQRDRYQRVLGYLYLKDETLINAKIVEDGYGFAYTKFPFSKLELFRKLEKTARDQDRGLWKEFKEEKEVVINSKCQKKTCTQISNCEEAKYLLKECGFQFLDSDKDGVPCESICKDNKLKVLNL